MHRCVEVIVHCFNEKSVHHSLIFRTVLPNKMSALLALAFHSCVVSAELSSHKFTGCLCVAGLHNAVMCQRERRVFLWKAFEALESRMPLRGAQYPVWGSVDCFLLSPSSSPLSCPPLFESAKSWTLIEPPGHSGWCLLGTVKFHEVRFMQEKMPNCSKLLLYTESDIVWRKRILNIEAKHKRDRDSVDSVLFNVCFLLTRTIDLLKSFYIIW